MTSLGPTPAAAAGRRSPVGLSAEGEADVLTAATYDLVEELSEAGVELSVKDSGLAFKAPPGRLTDAMKARIREQKEALLALLGPHDAARARAPELQQSYWLGEAGESGVAGAGYWYNRFSVASLDVSRLQAALDVLFARHDALRMIVGADGRGRILEDVGPFPLEVHDLRAVDAAAAEREIEAVQGRMRRPHSAVGDWPLYRMCVQQAPGRFVVHVCGRLLVADATSWHLYVEELRALLEDPRRDDLPEPGRLASVVLRRFRRLVSPEYQRARQYWSARELPPSPLLPVRGRAEGGARFERLIGDLPEADAGRLSARAKELGLTLDNVMLAAFALVLARWGQHADFCINVLQGAARHLGLPLGQFGGILRLELNVSPDASFAELAGAIRRRLAADMSHASVDGTLAQRIAARDRGAAARGGVVAYSSGLSVGPTETEIGLAQLGWKPEGAYIQSPGVVVDQQVFRTRDGLRFHWDVDVNALHPGVAESMFDAFFSLLHRLAGTHDWATRLAVELPERQRAARARANDTSREQTVHELHALLEARIRDRSDAAAVVTPGRTLSFAELGRHAGGVASALRARGIGIDSPVAVIARKGWEQVVAALGIVRAGAAYVPVDPSWPPARMEAVLTAAGCEAALCDTAGEDALGRADGARSRLGFTIRVDAVAPSEASVSASVGARLAYIMFTSGSTGEPKGVAISHAAVANTIEDVLRRFEVGPEDSVLGVSNLHFDLSVFDIFGVLGAGGRLVLPPAKSHPDPTDLVPLIEEHGVTIWNTVPAIFEMLVEYMEARDIRLPSLRLALLSGDWIPVSLPARIRKVCPNARVVGLGGATEASIWSNSFEVGEVPDSWSSIPYGFPLANQQFLILGNNGEECPDWVEGDLAIAGRGLADGYWRSPERTAAAFVHDRATGLRIYRTGDRARRWPDGNVEFLGRSDDQVKIGGYRVELGDVTAALKRCTGVEGAAAVAVGTRDHRWLAAFVTPAGLADEALRAELHALLPSYMVPRRILRLAALPLTANGKLDHGALTDMALRDQPATATPSSPGERLMAELWSEVLGRPIRDTQVSFFEVGGESVLAVRLANAIEQRTGVRPDLADLLRAPTVEGMAAVLGGARNGAHGALVRMQRAPAGAATVVCVHPVGGAVYCYRGLVDKLGKDVSIVGLQSLGGDPDDASLRGMAKRYTEQLNAAGVRPDVLFGWSLGGVLALELQRCFAEAGSRRIPAILVDPWVRGPSATVPDTRCLEVAFIRDVLRGAGKITREELSDRLRTRSLIDVVRSLDGESAGLRATESEIASLFEQFRRNTAALMGYDPPEGPVDADVWVADDQHPEDFAHLQPLSRCCSVPRAHHVRGDHYSIMEGEALSSIAAFLRSRLEIAS
ncbi:hypothetical protein BE20_36930 [Sorangium cellulosum]|nr:hypothetical protein BE20_36930 [Sorangium cellulosum]